MPKGLRRFHQTGDWHFITCSCYHRQKFLDSVRRRDLFLDILEQVRAKYDLVVAGYVVMPEHFHLLVTEPRLAKLSLAMQVLKQRVSLRAGGPAFACSVRLDLVLACFTIMRVPHPLRRTRFWFCARSKGWAYVALRPHSL